MGLFHVYLLTFIYSFMYACMYEIHICITFLCICLIFYLFIKIFMYFCMSACICRSIGHFVSSILFLVSTVFQSPVTTKEAAVTSADEKWEEIAAAPCIPRRPPIQELNIEVTYRPLVSPPAYRPTPEQRVQMKMKNTTFMITITLRLKRVSLTLFDCHHSIG